MPARVLIIDDDSQIGGLLAQMLGRFGYDVTVAACGEAGLSRLAQGKPDFVLLDATLPGMSGLQTLIEIKKLFPPLPVVMCTGLLDEEFKTASLAAGADSFLSKPFDFKDLLASLRRLTAVG